MIVGFIPGPGHTIRNARVVLKPDETLPNRYNVLEAEVLRLDAETYQEILIKPIGSILPADSDILSQPEIAIGSILDLTISKKDGSVYEHADIIRFGETDDVVDDSDEADGAGNSGVDNSGTLVP